MKCNLISVSLLLICFFNGIGVYPAYSKEGVAGNIDLDSRESLAEEKKQDNRKACCLPFASFWIQESDLKYEEIGVVFGFDLYHPVLSKYNESLSETIGMNFFLNYKIAENSHRILYFVSTFSFDRFTLKTDNSVSLEGIQRPEFMIFKFLIGIEDELKLSNSLSLELLLKTGIAGSGFVFDKNNPLYDYSKLDPAIATVSKINNKACFPVAAGAKMKVYFLPILFVTINFEYTFLFYAKERLSMYSIGAGIGGHF